MRPRHLAFRQPCLKGYSGIRAATPILVPRLVSVHKRAFFAGGGVFCGVGESSSEAGAGAACSRGLRVSWETRFASMREHTEGGAAVPQRWATRGGLSFG